MTKRETLLSLIRVAGYHDDHRTALRIHIENRSISQAAYRQAWAAGRAQRAAGIPCTCPTCAREKALSGVAA